MHVMDIYRGLFIGTGAIIKLSMIAIWASCQIRKIAGAHAPGMPGTFSPPPRG